MIKPQDCRSSEQGADHSSIKGGSTAPTSHQADDFADHLRISAGSVAEILPKAAI
jgi:hypothetical protein